MATILQSYPTSTIPLSRSDRLQQTCIIGANGVGKSNTLLKLILRDVHAGYGLCLLDPHGELLTDVVKRLPRERGRDVVLLSLTNPELSFGLNLFACRNPRDPIAVQDTVSTVVNIFEKVFGLDRASMGRQLTYLRSLIYLFIHTPSLSPLAISHILNADSKYDRLRAELVANLPHTPGYDFTREFWTEGFSMRAKRAFTTQDNELFGTLWKFQEMTSDLLYPFFCQQETIDFSELMVQKKIVLCKLNSSWPDVTSLVGSILISHILHAGFAHRHTQPFFVYCDEFQNFATADFARLFAEARKFAIGMTIATQTLSQVPQQIIDVCMQAGIKIVYRVSSNDAAHLAGYFHIEPDPAREEVLEEEWVEVLEPVQHKRVEEDIIDGEKPVRIPKFNVIDHLLNVGHPNDAIATFVMQYLQFLKSEANYQLDIHPAPEVNLFFLKEEQEVLKEHLEHLNNMLFLSMQFQQIPSREVLAKITENFADKLGFGYYQQLVANDEVKLIGELSEEISENVMKQEERYDKFYTSLSRMLAALAEQPIEVESGQWEPRIRKQINYLTDPPFTLQHPRHALTIPQRSWGDVKEEIISGLTELPNFMACVKTPSGEYLVQTTPPPPSVSESDFWRRLRWILNNNVTEGYLKRRAEVQQELIHREPLIPVLPVPQSHTPHHAVETHTVAAPPSLPQSRRKRKQ